MDLRNCKTNITLPLVSRKGMECAPKINCELSQVPTLSENELELFSTNYELNLLTLNHASDYFEDDRQEQIYKWCLAFSKEL